MIDDYLKSQFIAYNIINRSITKKNISHAYLIEDNGYSNSLDFAISFAKTLLCPFNKTNCLDCKNCTQCKKIDDNNFLDLEIIEPDNGLIKKEQLIKLQKDFSTKPIESDKKIYIINHADKLNDYSSNSILKLLEEPEDNIVAILICNNCNNLLDTIISRCQKIKLNNINETENLNEIEVISSYICNSRSEMKNFKLEEENHQIVEKTVQFLLKFEKSGVDVLLEENNICGLFIKDKNLFEKFLSIMILFYNDILNYKINQQLKIFSKHIEEISNVSNKCSIYNISEKIKVIVEIKEKISYNCNLNLLLDKLIILLREGE